MTEPTTRASPPAPSLEERAFGAYLGLAVGDALGATVEFMTATEIRAIHGVHRELTGGGWLRLRPGQVTDDTQMALAVGRALISSGRWELRAAAEALAAWMRSRPVDIGHTCRRGIRRYLLEGSLEAPPAEDSAGNGAAVRSLPLTLACLHAPEAFTHHALEQARLTHHHPLSDLATLTVGRMTRALLFGGDMAEARRVAAELVASAPAFRFEPWPGNTSGYIVDTLQSVLAGFFSTTTFEDCLVQAVNRGGDADTIGALVGQLAGARYGVGAIPTRWLRRLDPAVQAEIRAQTGQLLRLAGGPTPGGGPGPAAAAGGPPEEAQR